jgi:hypothetical protein
MLHAVKRKHELRLYMCQRKEDLEKHLLPEKEV